MMVLTPSEFITIDQNLEPFWVALPIRHSSIKHRTSYELYRAKKKRMGGERRQINDVAVRKGKGDINGHWRQGKGYDIWLDFAFMCIYMKCLPYFPSKTTWESEVTRGEVLRTKVQYRKGFIGEDIVRGKFIVWGKISLGRDIGGVPAAWSRLDVVARLGLYLVGRRLFSLGKTENRMLGSFINWLVLCGGYVYGGKRGILVHRKNAYNRLEEIEN